jgi:hypothetical protein
MLSILTQKRKKEGTTDYPSRQAATKKSGACLEITNYKIQITNKLQITNYKLQKKTQSGHGV